MKFRDLQVNDTFEFDRSERWASSLSTGPWLKTSARKYIRLSNGLQCRVGSVNAEIDANSVNREEEEEKEGKPPLPEYFANMADIRRRNPTLR